MQRFAEPDEISGIVSFLADNERRGAKYVGNLNTQLLRGQAVKGQSAPDWLIDAF